MGSFFSFSESDKPHVQKPHVQKSQAVSTHPEIQIDNCKITNPINSLDGILIEKVISKESASNSIIAMGTFNGNNVYFKFFDITKKDQLYYESMVYFKLEKLIRKNPSLNLENAFIRPKHFLEINKSELLTLLSLNSATKTKFIDEDKKVKLGAIIGCVITENIGNIQTLVDFRESCNITSMTNLPENSKRFIKMLFVLLYYIFVMNEHLKINHNDLHFGNVLIKIEQTTYKIRVKNKQGEFKDINYTVPFKIKIFDFDQSYAEGCDNPLLKTHLCTHSNSCNKISQKDRFIFLCELIYPNIKGIVEQLSKTNSDMPKNFYNLIDNHVSSTSKNGYAWHKLCNLNENNNGFNYNNCNNVDLKWLRVELITHFYKSFKNVLGINLDDYTFDFNFPKEQAFHKKYLSYKMKYLNLKNNISL